MTSSSKPMVDILDSEENDVDLLELQGDVENMDLFDGILNKNPVQLEFKTFILPGRKISKEFGIMEKSICDGKPALRIIKRIRTVYLFDKPPRYRRESL